MGRHKKVENMTQEERIQYFADKREQEAEQRRQNISALSHDQLQAVKDLYWKLDSVLDTAIYPDMGGIRAVTVFDLHDLVDANHRVRHEFNLDIRENG
tara:strand:- start:350 stop:643 length:294 start_codon:yes stop_codon:yes gene_type:complete